MMVGCKAFLSKLDVTFGGRAPVEHSVSGGAPPKNLRTQRGCRVRLQATEGEAGRPAAQPRGKGDQTRMASNEAVDREHAIYSPAAVARSRGLGVADGASGRLVVAAEARSTSRSAAMPAAATPARRSAKSVQLRFGPMLANVYATSAPSAVSRTQELRPSALSGCRSISPLPCNRLKTLLTPPEESRSRALRSVGRSSAYPGSPTDLKLASTFTSPRVRFHRSACSAS